MDGIIRRFLWTVSISNVIVDLHYECHSKILSELHKPYFRVLQFEMAIEFQVWCKCSIARAFIRLLIYLRAR